jgi:hypothetical protein
LAGVGGTLVFQPRIAIQMSSSPLAVSPPVCDSQRLHLRQATAARQTFISFSGRQNSLSGVCMCTTTYILVYTGGNTLVGGISSYLLTHGNYSRATQQALANAALQRQLQASSAQQAAVELQLQAASSIVTPVFNRKQRLV